MTKAEGFEFWLNFLEVAGLDRQKRKKAQQEGIGNL